MTCKTIVMDREPEKLSVLFQMFKSCSLSSLPPFSLIRDFEKQNTRGNVSKISVSLT